MSDLIAVKFEGNGRAAEVLDQLKGLQEPSWFGLDDAIAVYRTKRGHLRVSYSLNSTAKEGGLLGGAMGALIGALIAAPLTAGASAAVAAAAVAADAGVLGAVGAGVAAEDASRFKNEHGVPEDFVTDVSAALQPGESAILARMRAVDSKALAEHFRGSGGTLLRSPLSVAETADIQRIIR